METIELSNPITPRRGRGLALLIKTGLIAGASYYLINGAIAVYHDTRATIDQRWRQYIAQEIQKEISQVDLTITDKGKDLYLTTDKLTMEQAKRAIIYYKMRSEMDRAALVDVIQYVGNYAIENHLGDEN